ncbi:DNA replication and repair protein RecF [Litoreibacter halocynthiae]|uniref:DNA replication and repair protein RecF n=1 Tax=Litoreibacter halocynthiae TaxID=1242689 RepID=A0A4R7LDZ5_9RHOB|nr:DNA replication/repair protein RecF [Litoreibacter halocynthiae]TDT73833.1 DNA replication and repair protein RecF [Litoreibacter halocynthiae]
MAGLYFSALTLSHFRSHRRVELNLDDRPIAIFGSNGAGKTNILEAISMLSPGRGLRRAKVDEIARAPEALGWKVSGLLHSLGQLHEIETRAENGSNRTVSIDGKTAPQIALGRVARVVWLVPAMDRLWLEGAEGRRRFLDRMTLSFEPKHAEVTVAYEKAMRERNRLLKDMVRDAMWYGALESQMAEAGAQVIANRAAALARLQFAMENAQTSFPTAELSIENPDDADFIDGAEALLVALQASRSTDLRAGRTLVGPHRADMKAIYKAKNIEAKQCSTGEQKALLLSLILANARALSEDFGAAPIILLDEVAAHLDAGRRAALYDEICALKAQAWMTGTGAELFTELGDRAQHFEVSDDDGASVVEPR